MDFGDDGQLVGREAEEILSGKNVATARLKCRLNAKVVQAIKQAALKAAGDEQAALQAKARMIEECSAPKNIAVIFGMVDSKTGEKYDGYRPLYCCNSRFCQFCCRLRSREHRERADQVMEQAMAVAKAEGRLTPAVRWRFVTLTLKTMPDLHLREIFEVVQVAWALLRKRVFWKDRVLAGVKNVEFTCSANGGYHVHIHLLALSEFIEVDAEKEQETLERQEKNKVKGGPGRPAKVGNLDAEWGECLRIAVAKMKLSHICESETRVHVEAVKSRFPGDGGAPNGTASFIKALSRVTRYLTKAKSWSSVPPEQLVQLGLLNRWPRLFETFGLARKSDTPCATEDIGAPGEPLGIAPPSLRAESIIVDANGQGNLFVTPASLDKSDLSDGKLPAASGGGALDLPELPSPNLAKPARVMRKRALMESLKELSFSEWCQKLKHYVNTQRGASGLQLRDYLRQKHPDARIVMLDELLASAPQSIAPAENSAAATPLEMPQVSTTTSEMRNFELTDDNGTVTEFTGEFLAWAGGPDQNGVQLRRYEVLSLYRTRAGNYVLHRELLTTFRGERNESRVQNGLSSAEDVFLYLLNTEGHLHPFGRTLLNEARRRDPSFKTFVVKLVA